MSTTELHTELARALQLCQVGELMEAERIYRELIQAHTDVPDAWNMLAVVLYQQARLDEAVEAATRATRLRPQIAPYWLMRGNIELALRRFSEAHDSFGRAIAIDPDFAEAHYRLGLSYHGAYRLTDAERAYREALRYAPDVAEIHWQLAEALLAKGEAVDAMRAYQEAFRRDPGCTLDRRGCFDWLGRLHFEALPPLWHAELERFFERGDVDTRPYVSAGLRALKTKPVLRELLSTASADAPVKWNATLDEALRDRLFKALLRDCLVADAEFEYALTRFRAQLLSDAQLRAWAPLDFLCALGLQSFNNEYVWQQTDREMNEVAALRAGIEAQLSADQTLSDADLRSLLVLACYQRLDTVRGIESMLPHAQATPGFRQLLQRSVIDVRAEHSLREQIRSIGETTDAVSRAVRAMYEEHPYPRWFSIDREPPFSLSEWVERELPAISGIAAPLAVRALVAGCGTGRDATWIASNIAGAQVVAVDLSLSSLSYGRRMASAMALQNIEFRQGDILALSKLEQRFDLIASTGVLHHMADPQAGLRSIAGLLRPGGLMKLGFYSRRARTAVTAAREMIAQAGIPPSESEIRKFRQVIFAAGEESPLRELAYAPDFYSMSMCRDLLFHVEEHQYTLPQLGEWLTRLDLEFLGLAELPQDTITRYRRMFPADAQMIDIANWDAYEKQYPDTFSRMFLFWCRKTA